MVNKKTKISSKRLKPKTPGYRSSLKIKEVTCNHVGKNKNSLIVYSLMGSKLVICTDCEFRLRPQVIAQKELEKSFNWNNKKK